MKQEVAISRHKDTKCAVDELYKQLKSREVPALVIFMASINYDFEIATKEIKAYFPNSIVVGTTTAGEITKEGFTEQSIILTTLICDRTKIKAALIKDAVKFPILEKDKIQAAAQGCGITCGDTNAHKNALAMTFINGNNKVEESILALLHAVINNEDFQVMGGLAGDNLTFEGTFISLDGEITSTGAIVIFMKVAGKFKIIKENMYYPTGETFVLTDVDMENRKIKKIDHQVPAEVLAKKIKVPKEQLADKLLDHPLARVIGDESYICSFKRMDEAGMFESYASIMPNTKLEILKVGNVAQTVENTCQIIQESMNNVQFIFFVNCILKTVDLKNKNLCDRVINIYEKHFSTFCGYSCYGEQYNKLCLNQTAVILAIGE